MRVEDFNDLNLGATRRCTAWSGAVALVSDHVIRADARPTRPEAGHLQPAQQRLSGERVVALPGGGRVCRTTDGEDEVARTGPSRW